MVGASVLLSVFCGVRLYFGRDLFFRLCQQAQIAIRSGISLRILKRFAIAAGVDRVQDDQRAAHTQGKAEEESIEGAGKEFQFSTSLDLLYDCYGYRDFILDEGDNASAIAPYLRTGTMEPKAALRRIF